MTKRSIEVNLGGMWRVIPGNAWRVEHGALIITQLGTADTSSSDIAAYSPSGWFGVRWQEVT